MAGVFTIESILVFVLCYIIGSFPTAYLLVKAAFGKDVTREGSGNVGTLNSFQVSKSKWVGVVVLLTDLFKGLLPVYIMLYVMN
nr:glycerol-3-phosphate acyltransferase [Ignavibacteria bacterium]